MSRGTVLRIVCSCNETLQEREGKLLVAAAASGDIEALNKALANGVNPDFKDGRKQTALIKGALANDADVIRAMLEVNANSDLRTKAGLTALAIASQFGQLEAVKALVQGGVNKEAVSNNGWTPLIYAGWRTTRPGWSSSSYDHLDVVKFLVDSGCNLNAQTSEGFTLLMMAAGTNGVELTKILLDGGADASVQCIVKTTANAEATAKQRARRSALFEKGLQRSQKSLRTSRRETSLARESSTKSLTKTRGMQAKTALDMARDHGHSECVALILAAAAS